MKDEVLVSVITPMYNAKEFVAETIQSVLEQTYQNWELIIHDDNSKDNTVSIIKEYTSIYPDKIKFLNDDISTGGAKENFTYLLNNIDDNYDYVMFCDQDDVWLEDKIEITLKKMMQVEDINSNKPVLIHTDLKVVDEKLNIISESMFKYQRLNLDNQYKLNKIALENIITGCTVMLNKKLVSMSKTIPKEAIMHDWWIAIITLQNNGIIESVHLFGASIPANSLSPKIHGNKFQKIVNKKIMNYYSPYDDVLKAAHDEKWVDSPIGYRGALGTTCKKYHQKQVRPQNHRFASYAKTIKSFP